MRRREPGRVLSSLDPLPRPFALGARESVDAIEQAHRRGVQEGLAAGRQEAQALHENEARELRERLAESLRQLGELQDRLARDHEGLLIQLALEAASRIARERIDAGEPVAARAVAEAVGALRASAAPLRVRLHPADLESVRLSLSGQLVDGKIELVEDARLARGGCVVESPSGSIDATLETALGAVGAAARGLAVAT